MVGAPLASRAGVSRACFSIPLHAASSRMECPLDRVTLHALARPSGETTTDTSTEPSSMSRFAFKGYPAQISLTHLSYSRVRAGCDTSLCDAGADASGAAPVSVGGGAAACTANTAIAMQVAKLMLIVVLFNAAPTYATMG